MGLIGKTPTVQQQAMAVLAGHGWLVESGVALAYKFYHTAVGPKKAHIYFEDGGPSSDNFILKGEYQSEGRNALEANVVLIPKMADVGAVVLLVKRFAADTDSTVAETYAMKLEGSKPRASEKRVEIINAKKYYGAHATGTVVLVNGQPSHFTGATALPDAKAFANKVSAPPMAKRKP